MRNNATFNVYEYVPAQRPGTNTPPDTAWGLTDVGLDLNAAVAALTRRAMLVNDVEAQEHLTRFLDGRADFTTPTLIGHRPDELNEAAADEGLFVEAWYVLVPVGEPAPPLPK